MIRLTNKGVVLTPEGKTKEFDLNNQAELEKNTMAYQILEKHNLGNDMENLKLRFDSLVSPDNNYVSILQTASASGIKEFPVPYVLSNCHSSLCAVGGTINQDDHVFGLDNVKKYGGIYIPPYKAILHQYMREKMAGVGKMILGSDSHTRYGALGTLAIGEGGGEIAKQLLKQSYDIVRPPVIAIKLTGKPKEGVGPMDVALTLIGSTFENNFNKNKILEFVGEGVNGLSVEYRMEIDVMTTECGALSSIWTIDEKVKQYLELLGRPDDYQELKPTKDAYYDGLIEIDLSTVECMMALPFHPSRVCEIHEFNANPQKYLEQIERDGRKIKGKNDFSIMDKLIDGKVQVDQALVSGCSAGLFENVEAVADILAGHTIAGDGIKLSINPASQPVFGALAKAGIVGELVDAGVTINPCICGPCFGVTDVPANNELSIRHVTRNYPNREGSKPGNNQMAAVFLMDARSIAATVKTHGVITAATDLDVNYTHKKFEYDPGYYEKQIFNNYKKADPTITIRKGPNIADWPKFPALKKHVLLQVSGAYTGSISTDDLSPSGDAVAYRSNPLKLAEFTMINRDQAYVQRAKELKAAVENQTDELLAILEEVKSRFDIATDDLSIGSVLVSNQIGDGSSREQAASSQKILGGSANIANEYATKRYRSNLINWGMLPIVMKDIQQLSDGDYLLIRDVDQVIDHSDQSFELEFIGKAAKPVSGTLGLMNEKEKQLLKAGCLINYNKKLLVK